MNKLYKSIGTIAILFLLAVSGSVFLSKNTNTSQEVHPYNCRNEKPTRKSLIVNDQRYDGPEKFAYYQAAIRAGQVDLTKAAKHPQYESFYKLDELRKAKKNRSTSRQAATSATYIERGPANVPGRTRSVIVDPDDATNATWFAASVSGGIWKTTNSGGSWLEIAPDLDNMAIVTLAMAESNTSVIYAGTGEGFIGAGTFLLNGEGIYKSTDKGVTWDLLPNTVTNDFINVSRIIVDPTDEDILLASTAGRKHLGGGSDSQGAIMRSTDGGTSWAKVHSTTSAVQQIIAAPSDFNTQYASILNIGVVKTTNAGLNWSSVSTGLSLNGRIELAVSSTNLSKVYGSALGTQSGTGSDLYVTENGGSSWSLLPVSFNGNAVDFLGGQGWYDNTILVNPYNDDHVYFGGVGVFAVTKSGSSATLDIIADVYSAFDGTNSFAFGTTPVGVHPDQHFMTAIKTNESASEFRVLLGNDGGMYLSNSATVPGTNNGDWTWSGAGYNTTQFYGADKLAGDQEYIAGAQDNGTWVSNNNEVASATSDFIFTIGGDGFEVVAHYTDPDKYIGGSQFNGFVGTENRGQNSYNATAGLSGNGPFVSRLSSAYQDPDVLFTVESGGVYRSSDFGRNWGPSTMNGGSWGFWSGIDVEVSKADPRIVWAGGGMSSGRDIYVSIDGGFSFNPVPDFANIGVSTGIYSHPTQPNTAFVVFSVANSPKILKTTDLGQTWTDISGYSIGSTSTGFPNVATFALQAMPFDDNVLWAGTEIGLFESLDGGATWAIIDDFPSVTIWDFKIKDGQVVIATHGRGIWTADIAELSGFTAPTVTLAPKMTASASLTALESTVNIDLRGLYDGTKIYANDVEVGEIVANAVLESHELVITFTEAGTYDMQTISTKNGIDYLSEKISVVVTVPVTPVTSYFSDFDQFGTEDFTLNRWSINQPSGFSSAILSTVHPYPINTTLVATLNIPIIVAGENADIIFQEVVQVEEGVSGTVFGDTQFWDYVVVEGSLDGTNWTLLLDGYDSDANSLWSGSSNSASSSLFAERNIDLLNTFSSGDIVQIRFRLFSDPGATAWGWGIDDLNIQAVDADDDGYNSAQDCDDTNPDINPGATDIPNNGIDEDCDGVDFIDVDEDGYSVVDDCDDTNPDINPGATDIPNNGIDEDCDGVDFIDVDEDGYSVVDDCDDANPDINPGATDIPNNGIDEDCSGEDNIVTGRSALEEDIELRLYPNPTSSYLNIETSKSIKTINIYSSKGVRVKVKHNTNRIEVSGLKSGIYLLIMHTDNGSFMESFIKK